MRAGAARGRVVSFVRHAHPEVDASIRPSEWVLTADGVQAAKSLALPPNALVISSPEFKALQTVALATGSAKDAVLVDAGFREVDRVEAVHDGYRAARRAWVSGVLDDRHEGWESPESAVLRVSDALRRYDASHLVVGTHGMILTAWLVHTGAVESGESAVEFWERLPFPAIVTAEVPGGEPDPSHA